LIYPICLLACVLVICLAVLMRTSMRLAAEAKAAQHETMKTWNPCQAAHQWIPIDVRPLESPAFTCKHVIALHRCSRCGSQSTTPYAGEWTIQDFLKTQADDAQAMKLMGR